MYEYKIHYLLDGDDMNQRNYRSNSKVSIGDVLELESGFFHVVVEIHHQKTQVRIDVSESAESKEVSILLAQQAELIN